MINKLKNFDCVKCIRPPLGSEGDLGAKGGSKKSVLGRDLIAPRNSDMEARKADHWRNLGGGRVKAPWSSCSSCSTGRHSGRLGKNENMDRPQGIQKSTNKTRHWCCND